MRSRKDLSRGIVDASVDETHTPQLHGHGSLSGGKLAENSDKLRLAILLGREIGVIEDAGYLLLDASQGQSGYQSSLGEESYAGLRSSLKTIETIICSIASEKVRRSVVSQVRSIIEMIDEPNSGPADIQRSVFELHNGLIEFFGATRLVKAIGIGRILSLMSNLRSGIQTTDLRSRKGLKEAFEEQNVATLTEWILELKDYLPSNSSMAVVIGLQDWARTARAANSKKRQSLELLVRDQAQLWSQLVAGELDPLSLLSEADYSKVSMKFARSLRRIILSILCRLFPLGVLVGAVVGVVVWQMQRVSVLTQSEILVVDICVAGIGAGSLFYLGSMLVRKTVAPVEKAIWTRQLDERIASVTVLHASKRAQDFAGRAAPHLVHQDLGAQIFSPERKLVEDVAAGAGVGVAFREPDQFQGTALSPQSVGTVVADVSTESAEEIERRYQLERRKLRRRRRWRGVIAVILLVAIIVALRIFVLQSFSVVSGSMAPTLQTGDRILVDPLPFVRDSIHAGDIVVFHKVAADATPGGGLLVVKRVIGLPGQRISSIDDTVYVNGIPLNEVWLPTLIPSCAESAYNIPSQVVPAGRYFVLGDCRGFSSDSRSWGTVPAGGIIGKVFFVYWRASHPWFEWF